MSFFTFLTIPLQKMVRFLLRKKLLESEKALLKAMQPINAHGCLLGV